MRINKYWLSTIVLIIILLLGTYYYFSWPSLTNEIIFPTLTSLGIFILGIIINKGYEWYRELNRLETIFNFFVNLCVDKIEILNERKAFFKSLSDRASNVNERELTFRVDLSIGFDRVSKISQSDLFKYLADSNKHVHEKNLSNVFLIIDKTEKQNEYSITNFNTFTERKSELYYRWKSNLESILKLQYKFASEVQSNSGLNNDFYKRFNSLMHEWYKNREPKNIVHTQENLVDRLNELIMDNFHDPRSVELSEYIGEATYAYNGLNTIHNHYSKLFQNSHIRLSSLIESLKEELDELKKIVP